MRIPLGESLLPHYLSEECKEDSVCFKCTPAEFLCTDSREIQKNDLFVALDPDPKRRTMHVAEANRREASAAIIHNTLLHLGKMAYSYRIRHAPKTVAITGSYGKTTVKDLLLSILSQATPVHATHGNYNNELGLPLTILSMPTSSRVLILEMGMRQRGEIAELSRIAVPDIAIITAVGSAHIGRLGSIQEIRNAKLEICDGLSDDSLLITAPEVLDENLPPRPSKIMLLSRSADLPPCLLSVRSLYPYTVFSLKTNRTLYRDLALPAVGSHMAYNASLAILAAEELGAAEYDIRTGLQAFRPATMRAEPYTINGIHIIRDCYNASPETMASAAEILLLTKKRFPDGRAFALLGDMKELGKESYALHKKTGALFGVLPIDGIFAFGDFAGAYMEGAKEAQFGGTLSKDALSLSTMLLPGDILLCKSSRSMQGENLLNQILNACSERTNNYE